MAKTARDCSWPTGQFDWHILDSLVRASVVSCGQSEASVTACIVRTKGGNA